jgi:hypothetical protein
MESEKVSNVKQWIMHHFASKVKDTSLPSVKE